MDREAEPGARETRSPLLRHGPPLVVAGLAIAFAVLNLDEVPVNWILGTASTPLIAVVIVSLAAGGVLGYVAGRRRRA